MVNDNPNYDYHNTEQAVPSTPYGSGDPYYNKSSGYIASGPAKRPKRNWLKFGIPIAILVIVGAVLGGVFGSRASKKNGGSSGGSNNGDNGDGNSSNGVKNGLARFPASTDSFYGMPIYPSSVSLLFYSSIVCGNIAMLSFLFFFSSSLPLFPIRSALPSVLGDQTNSALYGQPTFSTNTKTSWPSDSFKPTNPSPTTVRPDRPRIIAPAYKWNTLPNLIANDPYLSAWNKSIFQNATDYFNASPVKYNMDGASGILDNSREIKMRIKAFAYCYRMSNNTKWVDRAWDEIQVGCLVFFFKSIQWVNWYLERSLERLWSGNRQVEHQSLFGYRRDGCRLWHRLRLAL